MNENYIKNAYSDSKFNIQYCVSNNHDSNEIFEDNDSDSSILNLLDLESLDKTPEGNLSPQYSVDELNISQEQRHHSKILALPDITSDATDSQIVNLLLSKLPQIIIIKKPSLQYQILDQNYPCLTNSFKNCFTSPVLDLLVVVLNTEKLVSFYQGYFAGTSKLATELINLNGKYWKTLISNNDENAWENYYKLVTDKFNSFDSTDLEFEVGPVIRCRLRASNKHQFNQQFNYFFVQPSSYMVKLTKPNQHTGKEFNLQDVYMVSYINIMRECDTEYSLKGSAAATLQKVINNSIKLHQETPKIPTEPSLSKSFNNRTHRTVNGNSAQLSINISSPSYINSNKSGLSAPLTYPLVNDQLYSKQRPQIQHHVNHHSHPMSMCDSQYMSINVVDQNQQHYQTHYQAPQSTSTLQYILENRNLQYPNQRQITNTPHHMLSHHSQAYQNTGRPNVPCYLPIDHNQLTPSNCSLSSPTAFMPTRHLMPMSSNGILLPSDQYFRNSHNIKINDPVQVAQPIMTVMRSMSSSVNLNSNSYYCTTTPSQSQPSLPVINSLPYQNHFSSSTLPQYSDNKSELITMNTQCYQSNHMINNRTIKQESTDMACSPKNWHTSQIMEDSIASTYCGTMTNDSISFDIVEEILKAEEEKSENKHQTKSRSNSDNSDPLSFDFDDLELLDNEDRSQFTNNVTSNVASNTFGTIKHESYKPVDIKSSKDSSTFSDSFFNLKSETLEKFTDSQKTALRNLAAQYKIGKLTKDQMLLQINDFVSRAFGKNDHYHHVAEFWKTQHPNVDSTLSNFNCTHIVQSPEEGPGISPTEQAAQSTTDMEDEKDMSRQVSRLNSKKYKDDSMADLAIRRSKSKSTTQAIDASIYSITSTTSTGVLETLLNEHDYPINSEKSYAYNFSTTLPLSSTQKNQLSLDQLLMDDDYSMLTGYTTTTRDNKISKKTSDNTMRQHSTNNKSQPTTPSMTSNIGVLEALLNQKNPSLNKIRQNSANSILKHSKPSRQNSFDTFFTFHDGTFNTTDTTEDDNGLKNNSLLITLLNNSNGNASSDKYHKVNSSASTSSEVRYSVSHPKRQRTISDVNLTKHESSFTTKHKNENLDVFDFVDYELNFKSTEFQSGAVTSSQSTNIQKMSQCKRNRKRCYSRDASNDSDSGSDKLSFVDKVTLKLSSVNDKKTILTSLLDNTKINDRVSSDSCSTIDHYNGNFALPTTLNTMVYDDTIDFDDIKIDDFDLEHLIDESGPLDDSSTKEEITSSFSHHVSMDSVIFSDSMVPSVINISQSVPINAISKQTVIQVSDKNSISISAIQSTPSTSIITVESLDNERERLLKQQQQQKVCMGGKYLNKLDATDVDTRAIKMNRTLSLDLLSKQMKEVVPNVMVEQSSNVESFRLRKSSYSHLTPVISPKNPPIISESLVGRSCSTDCQSENSKQLTPTSSQVNHQQVREGLRQLVSNRSAQNSSRNFANNQRISAELMSPNSDSNVNKRANNKSMIHYHSEAQIPSNQQLESTSVCYPVPNMHPTNASINGRKATNILEDSLVNDVFELEELIKSKTSNPTLENNGFQNINLPQCTSEISVPNNIDSTQLMYVSSDMNSNTIGESHHHHHLHHYHPPPHHKHHSVAVSSTPTTKDKQTANYNAGLLETLLSR